MKSFCASVMHRARDSYIACDLIILFSSEYIFKITKLVLRPPALALSLYLF